MKKSIFMLMASALLLTGCANDELVDKSATTAKNNPTESPISFNTNEKNISRAAITSKLDTKYYQFGVFAYKADNFAEAQAVAGATTGQNIVMNDYMVGFTNPKKGKGYYPNNAQDLFTDAEATEAWYYEGLGNTENKYTWSTPNALVQANPYTSTQANQYLKYWDQSKTYTYFFAYEPYAEVTATPNDGAVRLEYPTIDISQRNWVNYMYASKKCTNAEYALQATGTDPVNRDDLYGTNNFNKVDLEFKYLQSRIRLAFYNAIPGYDVYLVDYSATNPGVIAVPAKNDGAAWTTANYVYTADPVVDFTEDAGGNLKANVSFLNPNDVTTGTGPNIVCPIDYFYTVSNYTTADRFNNKALVNNIEGATGVNGAKLGDSYATRIFGETCNVIPYDVVDATGDLNCGFTINVSLLLVAKDTKEFVYVHNARVHVDKEYTDWKSDYLYTYVFRITHTVPGTTGPGEDDPSPEPNTNPSLIPIVFDKVTVTDMVNEEEKEWDVYLYENDTPANPHDPSVH